MRKKITQGPALPGKLADCTSSDLSSHRAVPGRRRLRRRLSAKQARDKEFQAILPLRGKILNTWEVESGSGARLAGSARPRRRDRLRSRQGRSRACVTARSSSSPTPIPTACTSRPCCRALFLRHFPALVREGHVFVAMPPLFRVDVGKQVFYCLDEDEKRRDARTHPARKDEGRGQRHPLQGPRRDESAAASRIDDPSRYAPPRAAHRRRWRRRHGEADGHAAGEEARERSQGMAGRRRATWRRWRSKALCSLSAERRGLG